MELIATIEDPSLDRSSRISRWLEHATALHPRPLCLLRETTRYAPLRRTL